MNSFRDPIDDDVDDDEISVWLSIRFYNLRAKEK